MQKERTEKTTSAGEFDRLSKLLNRHAGEVRLAEELQKAVRNQQILCVALLDINDLTDINQTYGHQYGDTVIVTIAEQLLADLREQDCAVRLSGNEFLCIYPDSHRYQIHERLQLILEKLARDSKNEAIQIGYCYGLKEIKPTETTNVKKVIMECDDAMYQWKRRYHLDKARRGMKARVIEDDDVKKFTYDEKRLLHALSESSDDYIYICNMEKDPTTFLYSMSMVEEFDLPGQVVQDAALVWGAHVHEGDRQSYLESNQEIADNRANRHNVEYRAKNKEGKWVWLRCRGYVERDVDGKAILFAGMITNLARKNRIDYLTGLLNRYEFEDTIEQLLSRRDHLEFAVMLLDLDNFSSINKFYNHHFGDAVLARTAQQIQSLLPQGTKMFRHDGDEFHVVFSQDVSKEHIEELFTNIQKIYHSQQELDGKKYHISVSAAAVFCPQDALDFINLSKNLRYTLDHSKRNGRNRISFYEKGMRLQEMRELDLLEQLRYSVEHDFMGFDLHFQPQVSAETQKIVGAEALARWKSDIYGNVPPLVFIPLLEKSGMIHETGRWIFKSAVHRCKEFMETMPEFGISINLSYVQLSDPSFLAFMRQVLQEEAMGPDHIVVEMTESYMVKDDEKLQNLFQEIRALGVRIAMDDFGTGYSSLGVLKNAPADIVKIDKVFIRDILTSDFDATFIRFVVTLCHDVDIRVLLEGVETREEYEKVKEMGLDYIQGYYFGKPQPEEALIQQLQAIS